eukprot:3749882-Rhodomonas_salina.1
MCIRDSRCPRRLPAACPPARNTQHSTTLSHTHHHKTPSHPPSLNTCRLLVQRTAPNERSSHHNTHAISLLQRTLPHRMSRTCSRGWGRGRTDRGRAEDVPVD